MSMRGLRKAPKVIAAVLSVCAAVFVSIWIYNWTNSLLFSGLSSVLACVAVALIFNRVAELLGFEKLSSSTIGDLLTAIP